MSEQSAIDDIRSRLSALVERLAQRSRLLSLSASVEEQARVARERLDSSAAILSKEREDVDKLEGLSLTSILATVFSNKSERLQVEREELAQAKLRYDECFEALRVLDEEHARLERELDAYDALDEEKKKLLHEKALALEELGGDKAEQLQMWIERVSAARSRVREGEEALRAGYDASRHIADVIDALAKARNWGTIDMMGGGMATSIIKHSRVDAARGHANLAQQTMRRFERELGDFVDAENIGVEIPEVAKFADVFFDGLIFDWIAQRRINSSAASARDAQSRLRRVLTQLETAVRAARESCTDAERGYREFLLES